MLVSNRIANASVRRGQAGRGRLLRLSVCAAVLLPAFYGSLVVYGLGPSALVNGQGEEMERQPATEAQRALAARLDEDIQRVDAWSAGRWRIVDELTGERLNLRQAVDAVRELGKTAPEPYPDIRRAAYAGPNEEASYARQLLDHVQTRLRGQPDKAARVLARLQPEHVALAR